MVLSQIPYLDNKWHSADEDDDDDEEVTGVDADTVIGEEKKLVEEDLRFDFGDRMSLKRCFLLLLDCRGALLDSPIFFNDDDVDSAGIV